MFMDQPNQLYLLTVGGAATFFLVRGSSSESTSELMSETSSSDPEQTSNVTRLMNNVQLYELFYQ